MPGLSVAQITARLDAILRDRTDAAVVALGAAAGQEWPPAIVHGGRHFVLTWADSPLAVRAALADRSDGEGLIVLTPLAATALSADVLARLHRGQVFAPDRWQMVREAFQANDTDPRLRRLGWMAEILLDHVPPDGYPPAAGGVLDLDTAWRQVLRVLVGFGSDRPDANQPDTSRPDADSVLAWTIGGDGPARYAELAQDVQCALRERLVAIGSPAIEAVAACLSAGHGDDALPIGLVCRILFDPAGAGDPTLATGRGRLEMFTGGHAVEAAAGQAWADAAERVVGRLIAEAPGTARRWLDRADHLVRGFRIEHAAASSGILPSGFEKRLEAAATALSAVLAGKGGVALDALEAAARQVQDHAEARQDPGRDRAERLDMAVRVVRWLVSPVAAPATLVEAIQDYARSGGYADRARRWLAGGDLVRPLADACATLAARARDRREEESRRFAALLAEWNRAPQPLEDVFPVEQVLEGVVMPLMRMGPVLLLVLDGLSIAVFRELLPQLLDRGWHAVGPHGRERLAIATIPTITEASRASLLAGRLARGDQSFERQAFSAHAGLIAAYRGRRAPALFHKGDLVNGTGGSLSEGVREALAAPEVRAVGIVYNAVDDQLAGADQINLRWRVSGLRLLDQILQAARAAGRVVVLTADHGHVPEDGTSVVARQGGDRWCPADGTTPGDGEIALTGPRVLTPDGSARVVVPWSERVRYGGRKNGYHGGAAPAEVIVPLAVLAPAEDGVSGWAELPPPEPPWWDAPVAAFTEAPPAPRAAPPRRASKAGTAPLPDLPRAKPVPARDWIGALLSSETFAVQRRLAGGRPLDDIRLGEWLEALSERGGRWTRTALAQRLREPALRLGGILSQLRRLLNVDGYAVLDVDEAAGMVTFDHALLVEQFQLAIPVKGPNP